MECPCFAMPGFTVTAVYPVVLLDMQSFNVSGISCQLILCTARVCKEFGMSVGPKNSSETLAWSLPKLPKLLRPREAGDGPTMMEEM